jgi:hypothetical protein
LFIRITKRFFPIFSIQLTTSSASKPISGSTGDQHNTDLEHIEIKLEKTNDEQIHNPKHSTNNHTNSASTTSGGGGGGFSLKNPVSSFRSWVSNKKSSKDDPSSSPKINHSITTYGKIDTSPTPRKLSLGSDTTKRTRTNSASATTTSSVINNNHHQQIQSNSSATSSTRVKKKSSFTLRNTNPIAMLKRTPETNHNQTDISSTEHSGTGGGGPFGYLKNLVRGDSSSSEKKQ